ncbi:MAG: zinc ribbon domain-containing protein, partial [Planctomycetota bacterium]
MKITTLGQEQTRKCPFCAEVIRPEAIKCRYCGEFLNTGLAKAAQTMASTETVVKDDQEQEQHDQPDDNILYHG